MAAKSTNTKKSSTNNTAKAAKNATTKKTSTAKKASAWRTLSSHDTLFRLALRTLSVNVIIHEIITLFCMFF